MVLLNNMLAGDGVFAQIPKNIKYKHANYDLHPGHFFGLMKLFTFESEWVIIIAKDITNHGSFVKMEWADMLGELKYLLLTLGYSGFAFESDRVFLSNWLFKESLNEQ